MAGTAQMTQDDRRYQSNNPHRLYRDPKAGVIFGVCAGLADYFGVKTWQVRAAAVLMLLFFPPWAVFLYLAAAIFVPRRPEQRPYRSRDEEAFWRSVSGRPEQTLSALRYRFRSLEERLAGLEGHVTSDEFKLHRAFRDIE